ncbi:MAG: glycosyltransferase [Actinomycetota bacterium]
MNATVIICVYTLDRWDVMCRAVASVDAQDTPAELIVVVDHHDELLERARSAWPDHVVLANRFEQGLSGARNTGVFAASHDLIAFLDDDAVARDGWLTGLLDPFADDGVGVTGGRIVPDWVGGVPRWFPDEFLWVVGCSYRGQPTTTAEIRNPIGASMAARRQVFEQVGLFRSGVGRVGTVPLGGEETELSIRARDAGWRVMYEPSSVVDHEVGAGRGTVAYFRSRCSAEGRSKATISDVSGGSDALDAERSYATRTLPSGVLRRLLAGLTGPHRRDSLAQAAMLVVGLATTVFGYARGRFGRRGVDGAVETTVMELPVGAHTTRPAPPTDPDTATDIAPPTGTLRAAT